MPTVFRAASLLLLGLVTACHDGTSVGDAGSDANALQDGGADLLSLGGDGSSATTLTLTPTTQTLTIVDPSTPVTQAYSAFIDGVAPVDPNTVHWQLSTYAQGTISSGGVFSTTGLVGGVVQVSATYGDQMATAQLTVKVKLAQTVSQGATDPGPSAQNVTALGNPPSADPGASLTLPNATKILYPYDQTVMPRGLIAPILQFSPGNLPPEDALVTLSSANFSWAGTIHVQTSATPQFAIPQNIWDAALLTAGGQTLTISVVKAVQGAAYGPAISHVLVAPASLTGAVYYMTYDTPGEGLYSVLPGKQQAATLQVAGCVVCHSVAANGTKLALGADDAADIAGAGVYDIDSTGTATQITPSPLGISSGGDTRGLSYATFTPDGKYVLRSPDNFWGGVNQEAWFVDDVNNQLVPATVVGLGASVSAYVPAISPDGKRYAFTNGDGDAFGTPRNSLSVMDLDIDTTSNTLTFTNRQLLLDNGATGLSAKFVSFLPDTNYLVFQQGSNYCASYGGMLPSWDTTCSDYSFAGSTGSLYMVDVATQQVVTLNNLNAGNATLDAQRNYEPFALPVTAGGYFWVVFTSIREYGNTYTGSNVRKQIWVSAISVNPTAGEDPSHPPFYLPNQTSTRNERGVWALEPCHADGTSCTTGDECCNGFCRPSDPNDPSAGDICQLPPPGGCSNVAERCTITADCCGAPSGITCIGGYCTQPSIQ